MTNYTNMINGSDGTLAPPFRLDEKSTVYLFSTDVCRYVVIPLSVVCYIHVFFKYMYGIFTRVSYS